MSPVIRAATKDDLDFLCWVMFTAAKSHLDRCMWEMIFDITEEEALRFLREIAQSEPRHWCHAEKFLIAEMDGVPAGALCVFDPASEGTAALFDVMLAAAAQWPKDKAWLDAALGRALIAEAATPKDYPDAWGIENVAVRPAFRGKGVVDALLAEALAIAKESGREHAQILCLNGNIRAQRSWERHGFTVEADYRSSAFENAFGTAGLKLLARRLA